MQSTYITWVCTCPVVGMFWGRPDATLQAIGSERSCIGRTSSIRSTLEDDVWCKCECRLCCICMPLEFVSGYRACFIPLPQSVPFCSSSKLASWHCTGYMIDLFVDAGRHCNARSSGRQAHLGTTRTLSASCCLCECQRWPGVAPPHASRAGRYLSLSLHRQLADSCHGKPRRQQWLHSSGESGCIHYAALGRGPGRCCCEQGGRHSRCRHHQAVNALGTSHLSLPVFHMSCCMMVGPVVSFIPSFRLLIPPVLQEDYILL